MAETSENKGNQNKDVASYLEGLSKIAESSKKEGFIDIKKPEKVDLLDALKLVSPGTGLRTAIDEIVKARRGSLIVVDSENLAEIIEGGLKVNCKFTSQKLFELSKMDGAIVLSRDLKKILYANVLLVPNHQIPTNETGTRHKAAERTAKQAKTLVIAISEKRNIVKLYYHNLQYTLKSTEEILKRVVDKLQILEKQREVYNNLLSNLNKLEVAGLVLPDDIAIILQRAEMILKINEMMKREIIELGDEGALIKVILKELVKGIEKDRKLFIQDYSISYSKYKKEVSKLKLEDLSEPSKIKNLIFGENKQDYIKPAGLRLLGKISFPENDVRIIINKINDLNRILESRVEEIEKILKNKEKAEKFISEITKLKENILLDKGI